MIDKAKLQETVEQFISGTDAFLVDISITPENVATVTVDSPTGVDIDLCVNLTRKIEETFNRDDEDYELEVGSAGITAPFTVPEQYRMNVGNKVDILTADSRKLHGVLAAVSEDCSAITVEIQRKVKLPDKKRPVMQDVPEEIAVKDIRSIVRHLEF